MREIADRHGSSPEIVHWESFSGGLGGGVGALRFGDTERYSDMGRAVDRQSALDGMLKDGQRRDS